MRSHVLVYYKENNIGPPPQLNGSIDDGDTAKLNGNVSPNKTESIPAIVDIVVDQCLHGNERLYLVKWYGSADDEEHTS